MEPERWRRIEEVFQEAVELPAGDQSAFLDRLCANDTALRLEVENLLESDRQAQHGIKSAVDQAASSMTDDFRRELSAYIGLRIGPYQIVREIGRGGMGAVYQAVRVDDQYLQSVAIKFIAQGMDTPDSLSRFRIERQILATLHHPNIAGLLDGGTTEDGKPYIVMEYIEGEPLLDYCRKRNLPVAGRLELFQAVCGAVHHAHQMLVIHRDLKPGNVLVTAEGIPKLLDFGIAKLLAPELAPGGLPETRTVMRMLTPEYASPEQVRGQPLTTASDIYSLGVVLYELLSSSSPYRITGRLPQELEKAVCDSEPRRLSTATDDARLRRQLAGDLENIVAMALRKEPARRYGSALQLSEDIQKFIDGLPVSARKDTFFYLASKMVRRNKLASAAFALLVVSVIGGWAATIREAQRTQQRFKEVRKLANTVLFEFDRKIQSLPGAIPAREMLVRTALDYLNSLSLDDSDDLTLQWEISQAYELVGDIQGDPDGANLGQFPQALANYRKALPIVERLSRRKRDWETLSCLTWLHYKIGDLEIRTAGARPAATSYQQGLEVAATIGSELKEQRSDDLLRNGYQRLSNARLREGNVAGALENARLAEATATRVSQRNPGHGASANVARSCLQLGNILWLNGDLLGAWKYYQEAVTRLESLAAARPDSTTTVTDLQEAYRRAGDLQGNPAYFHFDRPDQARIFTGKALALAEQLATRDPHNAQAQAQLSTGLRRAGAVTRVIDPEQAVTHYRRAIAITENLMKGSPDDLTYPRDMANARLGLSVALRGTGRSREALAAAGAALSLQQDMLKRNPERVQVREDMLDCLLVLGELRLAAGETGLALEHFNQALLLARQLMEQAPENLYSERCLALVSQKLGDFHRHLARNGPAAERGMHAEEARRWYGKGAAIWSAWKVKNLAIPFSVNREKEVLALMASVGG